MQLNKMTTRRWHLITWFGERWSGDYPGGIFQWKWADGSAWASLDTFGNENGTTGWTTIIRSSNEDFPPGLYRVHHCARMPCKCSFSQTNYTPLRLHLFCIGSDISISNVPQSRIAAEAADISAAVAEPSPHSPPSPKVPKLSCQ
jgi:hypothetical protein